MKIERVRCQDLKNFSDLKHDLAKINCIFGPNGSGKSSFQEIVMFGLTGDAKSDILMKGKERGYVIVETENGHRVCRIVKNGKISSELNHRSTTAKSIRETLFNDKYEIFKTVSATDAISSMTAGKFLDFMVSSGLLPATTDLETVIKSGSLSPDAIRELCKFLPGMPATFGPEKLDEAYTACTSIRRSLKSELSLLEAATSAQIAAPTQKKDALKKRLRLISDELAKAKEAEKQNLLRKKAIEDRDRKKQELVEMRKRIAAFQNPKAPNPDEKEDIQKRKRECEKERLETTKRIAVFELTVESLERSLANLESSVCPLSDKLICKTDKSSVHDDLENTLSVNRRELQNERTRLERLTNLEKVLSNNLAANEKAEKEYNEYLRIVELCKQKESALPVIPQEVEYEQNKIEALNAEINTIERSLMAIVQYERYEDDLKKLDICKKKASVNDELINALSPKSGVRVAIMNNALNPLIARLNSTGNKLEISLVLDKGLRICAKPAKCAEPLELSELSNSEQIMVLFAVVNLLNELSDTKMLFLDDLDGLDLDSFRLLLDIIKSKEVYDRYDQIFLSGVNHTGFIDAIHAAGIQDCNIIELKIDSKK